MSYYQGNGENAERLQAIEVHPKFLSTYDEIIRPVSGWEKTGKVEGHERGHGCRLNCIYCNQAAINYGLDGERQSGYLSMGVDSGLSINSRLWIGDRIDAQIGITELSQAISDYPYYSPRATVILENTNDPGLDWDRTLEIVRMMREDHDHTGAINFITKMGISNRHTEEFRKLAEQGAKIVLTVTYSGLPPEIEPASSQARINTMRRFKGVGLPVIMAMRPMIEGINCSDDDIKRVLREVDGKVDVVTIGGLFVYNFTHDAFRRAGHPLDENIYRTEYAAAKITPNGIKARVRAIADEIGFKATIQSHNSCAIAQIMSIHYGVPTPDRIAHWQSPGGEVRIHSYCTPHCPAEQRANCQRKIDQDMAVAIADATRALRTVIEAQKQVGKIPPEMRVIRSIEFPHMLLIKNGSLLIEELFLLEQSAGVDINNLPTKEGLRYRSMQAIEIDMGLDFTEIYRGEILIGQEWYVVVNDVLDETGNNTLLRWMRGRNRARVNIINIRDLQSSGRIDDLLDRLELRTFGLQTREQLYTELIQIRKGLTGDE